MTPVATPPEVIRSVVFLGTPVESAVALGALADAGFEIPLVITRPDRRRGRGSELQPSPVKRAATERGLQVGHDLSVLGDSDHPVGREGAVDLAVVVAYGRIIPTPLLERLAMVNIHFSLLPRWRGAAPVERAILAGDTRTGVCLMEVAEGLDEGGIYATAEVDIGPEEHAGELRARLAHIGARLLVEQLTRGLGPAEAQQGEPVYAHKLDRSDYELDFTGSAEQAHRVVRLGRAWTTFRGRRLGVDAAVVEPDESGPPGQLRGPTVATPDGGLRLVTVRPEGRAAMPADQWLNGARLHDGERLG